MGIDIFGLLVYCVLAAIGLGIFYLLIKSAVKNGVKEAVSEMRHIFPVQQKNTRESAESDSDELKENIKW